MPERIHASCVALDGAGVLIRGPSGAGKSELALRLIDQPGFGIGKRLMQAALVADDQVELLSGGGQLTARAPVALAGLLEIRGLGIVRLEALASAPVRLVVDLTGPGERLPGFASQRVEIAGVALPILRLEPGSPAAPARIRAAMAVLADRGQLRA